MRSFKYKHEMELSEWFSILFIIILSIVVTVGALCIALTISVVVVAVSIVIGCCSLIAFFFTGIYKTILTKYKNRKKV